MAKPRGQLQLFKLPDLGEGLREEEVGVEGEVEDEVKEGEYDQDAVEEAHVLKSQGEVGLELEVVRLALGGMLELLNCERELAAIGEYEPQAVVQVGGLRVERHGTFQHVNRFVGPSRLVQ